MRLALSETDLHVHCIAWCYSHPDERLHHVYAVPNESPRSKRYGAELKRKGMTSGVSDIVIPIPSGPYGHLYVELKHGTNDITDAQAAFLRSMQACGNAVIVCDTLDQFQTFVREYLHEPWHFVGGI